MSQMQLIEQAISGLTRYNIVKLFPDYSPDYLYTTEAFDNPTYKGSVNIGNYLYRSTVHNNKGNYPLDNLGNFWGIQGLSNIYAMLDFEGNTTTKFEGDGEVEFLKTVAMTTLMIGFITGAGAVTVETTEPKHGVIDGIVLTESNENYLLTKGSWYADNYFTKQNVNWSFDNTILEASKDNYVYPKYTNVGTSLHGATDISISDNVVYVVNNQAKSIASIDISNPSNMNELDSYTATHFGDIQGIATSGDVAYIVHSDSITSIDISNPSNMNELDSYTSINLNTAKKITISGDVAYVTSGFNEKITSIDISNPSNMNELDSYTSINLNGAEGITISGDVAYVVSISADSITSIDISNPSNMNELDSYTSINLNGAVGIAISGTVAYVVSHTGNSITSIDITTPSSMSELDSHQVNLNSPRDIAISGVVAYVVNYVGDSITSIDITTPSSMANLNSYTSKNLDSAIGVSLSSNGAYVIGNISDKLTAIDITTPSAMTEISHFPETEVNIISVPTGFDAPQTPTGEMVAWMIATDASNNFVSLTDLREYTTLDAIEGSQQTQTLYGDQTGALRFDLPDTGEIVRVTFHSANGQDVEVGTLLAGAAQEMGDTLSGANFKLVPSTEGWRNEANFNTIVENQNLTQTVRVAEEARKNDSDVGFIIDNSESSNYQQLLYTGKVLDTPYAINTATMQQIGYRISGEPLISGEPIGADPSLYSKINTLTELSVAKGSGSAYSERSTEGYSLNEYDKQELAAINEARHEEAGLLSESGSSNMFLTPDVGATQTITVVDAEVYTIYFIEGDGTITLSGADTSVVSDGIENAVTFTANGTSLTCTVSGTTNKVQVEQSAFPTSYINFTTRTGDIASFDTAKNIPNLQEDWSIEWVGTPVFENIVDIQYVLYNYTDGNNFKRIYISNSLLAFHVKSGGVSKYSVSTILTSGDEIKVELTCESGIVKMYIDDVLKDTDDFSSVLDVPLADLTYIGSNNGVANTNFKVHTKTLEFYDEVIR